MLRWMLSSLLAGCLVLLSGCQELGVGHEGERCNEQGQCLPGLVCDGTNTCVQPVDGGDPDADGGLDAGDDGGDDGADLGDRLDGGDEQAGDGDSDTEPDPPALVPTWAMAWEGRNNNEFHSASLKVVLDGNADVILAGEYDHEFDFTRPEVGEPDPPSGLDIFVAKFDGTGGLLWAKSFGAVGDQHLNALAVDPDGNIYLGGSFAGSLNFGKYGADNASLGPAEGVDGYVVSLAPDGSVRWAKALTGAGNQAVLDLDANPGHTVYAAGSFAETMLVGGLVGELTSSDLDDAFVIAYATEDGNAARAVAIHGDLHQRATALVVDPTDQFLYLAGDYSGEPVDIGGLALCDELPFAAAAEENIFLLRIDTTLSQTCEWALALGDAGEAAHARLRDLLLVGSSDLWLTGLYDGQLRVFSEAGDPAVWLETATVENAWLAHFTISGDHQWWAGFGGPSRQQGLALSTAFFAGDPLPTRIEWTGSFDQQIDFGGGQMTTPSSQGDAFLALFDSHHGYIWSRAFGNTLNQQGYSVAAARDGSVYLAGTSTGDVTIGEETFRTTGNQLIFLVRLDPPE